MKKKIGFAAMVFILAAIFVCPAAYAKPYKSLAISDYVVDIPDDAVIPGYVSRLEMMHTEYSEGNTPDGTKYVSIINSYRDPDFSYFQEGIEEEVPVYVEIIKWEDGTKNPVHLVGIFFINENNKLEVYADRDCSRKPAVDKLERVTSEKFNKIKFKKVPREKAE